MKKQISRRSFLSSGVKLSVGANLLSIQGFSLIPATERLFANPIFTIKKGEKQLFVDDVMIGRKQNVNRKIHPALKLDKPVLKAEKTWEQGKVYDEGVDKRVYIYGTVLYDKNSGIFRMWYNRYNDNYFATSRDGINWERPNLGLLGNNNMYNLHGFDSPSFIMDSFEMDPSKR
jgi:hypothetical protein